MPFLHHYTPEVELSHVRGGCYYCEVCCVYVCVCLYLLVCFVDVWLCAGVRVVCFLWSAFVVWLCVCVVCVRGGVRCGCVRVGLCALWVCLGGVHFGCRWYVHMCVVCDVCYNRDVKGWKVYRASAIRVPHFWLPFKKKMAIFLSLVCTSDSSWSALC